jgi:hypothetical protein
LGSLLDGIAALPSPRRGPVCGVALALQALGESDRSDLIVAIDARKPDGTHRYTSKSIAHELPTELELRAHTIDRHRREDCRCRS